MALGTLGTIAAIGAAGAAGTSIASAARGNKDKVENSWLQNPEYPENTGARELWWKKLQAWGEDPNYGAITPDWGNIWETAQNRIKQYYEGSALSPGVKDRVRASLARRGMSESPASDLTLARVDAEMGSQLKDLATEQGVAQANLAEEGRKTWLSSLEDLEARKPQGQWQTVIKPDKTNQILNSLSGVFSGISSAAYGIQEAQNMNNMLKLQNFNNSVWAGQQPSFVGAGSSQISGIRPYSSPVTKPGFSAWGL